MLNPSKVRIIVDTNIWISFLIGKRIQALKPLIISGKVELIITEQLVNEIINVTQRPKLVKYFSEDKVMDFISLLKIISTNYKIKDNDHGFVDPKDNFLLTLAEISNADFLITGDTQLIQLGKFVNTKIIGPQDFITHFK